MSVNSNWLNVGGSFPNSLVTIVSCASEENIESRLKSEDDDVAVAQEQRKKRKRSKKTSSESIHSRSSTQVINQHQEISDYDLSSESEEDQALSKGLKLIECDPIHDIIFLPNGDVSAVIDARDQSSINWSIDKKRDEESIRYGTYRLDVPIYHISNGQTIITSNELSRRSYRRPSGIISESKQEVRNKTNICFVPFKPPMERASRTERYFSRGKLHHKARSTQVIRMNTSALRLRKKLERDTKQASEKSLRQKSIFSSASAQLELPGYGKILRMDVPQSNDLLVVIDSTKSSFRTELVIPVSDISIEMMDSYCSSAASAEDLMSAKKILDDWKVIEDKSKAALVSKMGSLESFHVDDPINASDLLVFRTELQRREDEAMKIQQSINTEIGKNPQKLEVWLRAYKAQKSILQLQRSDRFILHSIPSDDKELISRKSTVVINALSAFRQEIRKSDVQLFSDTWESLSRNIFFLHELLLGELSLQEVPESLTKRWNEAISECSLWLSLPLQHIKIKVNAVTGFDIYHARSIFSVEMKKFTDKVNDIEQNRRKQRVAKSRFQPLLATDTNPRGLTSESVPSGIERLHASLDEDMFSCSVNFVINCVCFEFEAGFTERGIAILQALVELNVVPQIHRASAEIMKEFEDYWESGAPRIGDSIIGDGDFNSWARRNVGLGAWLASEKKPLVTSSMFPTPTDLPSVYHLWNSNHYHTSVGSISSPETTESIIYKLKQIEKELELPVDIYQRNRAACFFTELSDDDEDDNSVHDLVSMNSNAHQKLPAAGANPVKADMLEVDEEGYAMVYSRVHGYKIRVKVSNDDSVNEYKKILQEIKGDEFDTGITDAISNEISGGIEVKLKQRMDQLQLICGPASFQGDMRDLPGAIRWKKDALLSAIQWRPLRANLILDQEAGESQPDRVVFYEDMKDRLLYASHSIRVGDAGIRLRYRLVTETLQCLGISMKRIENATSRWLRGGGQNLSSPQIEDLFSHGADGYSLFQNSICDYGSGGVDEIFQSILGAPPVRLAEKAMPKQMSVACLPRRNIICTYHHLLEVLARSTAAFGVGLRLSETHRATKLTNNGDSKLDFCIRLLQDVLVLFVTSPISTTQTEKILSNSVAAELTGSIIKLLVERFAIEQFDIPRARTEASNGESTLLRCKSVLEYFQSLPSPAEDIMDLKSWCSFVAAQFAVGARNNAYKVCDKLLKALIANVCSQSTLGSSPAKIVSSLPGAAELLWILCRDFLHLPNETYIQDELLLESNDHLEDHRQLSRVLDIAEVLGSLFRNYSGFLRNEKKKIDRDRQKSKSSVASTFEERGTSGSQEKFSRILENLHVLLQDLFSDITCKVYNEREERQQERNMGLPRIFGSSAHIGSSDFTLDICHVSTILAWTTLVSQVSISQFEGIPTGSKLQQRNDGNLSVSKYFSTLRNADAVFTSSISKLKSILFPISLESSPSGFIKSNPCSRLVFQPLGEGLVTQLITSEYEFKSAVEQKCLKSIEYLHAKRIELLLWVESRAFGGAPRGTSSCGSGLHNAYQLLGGSTQTKHLLSTAVMEALNDFPTNGGFLTTLVNLEIERPAGMLFLRSYFKHCSGRVVAGGGLSETEAFYWLAAESEYCKRQLNHILANNVATVMSHLSAMTENQQASSCATPAAPNRISLSQAQIVDEYRDRARNVIEELLASTPKAHAWSWLWIFYMKLELIEPSSAKKVFYRAIRSCGWSKDIWMQAQGPLSHVFDHDSAVLEKFIAQAEQRGLCFRF